MVMSLPKPMTSLYAEMTSLNQCQGFSSVCFRKVSFDVDAIIAILNALMEHVKIVKANGSIRVKTMIFGLTCNGMGVQLYCFFVLFILESFVSLFLPLLGRFLDLH